MNRYKILAETAKLRIIPFDSRCSEAVHKLIAKFLGMRAPLRCNVVDAILNVAKRRQAATIVVEDEYVEADYLETYSRHYSKAFKPKQPYCRRLHFFSKDVRLEDLFDLPDEIKKEAYLGYCTLRPTGQHYVSRTVMSPPHDPDHDAQFVPAAGRFRAHLVGQQLVVSGAPFIQQDANTFICAGAAIWSVARFMHTVHKTPRYFPAQITTIARESFSHGQIRAGLNVQQIVMTLQRMGLNPHVDFRSDLCELRDTDPDEHRAELVRLVDLIHVFVDSSLPPILAYTTTERGGGHAVTVVGHDIVEREFDQDEIEALYGGVLSNSYFVDRFYVMDDARGPYAEFSIQDTRDDSIPSLSRCDSVAIIAPMPPEVTLEYDDAREELWKLKEGWNHLLSELHLEEHGLEKGDYTIDNPTTNPIVLRTALLDSRAWKRQVLKGQLPQWLRMQYQALLLPKFIWVVEIGNYDTTNHVRLSDRRILGEVILDATANPHWPLDSWLSFHARGLYLDVEGHVAMAPDGFEPYPPLRRTDES